MTATDKLRMMLDESGIKWEKPEDPLGKTETVWCDIPLEFTAIETSDGELTLHVEHRYWLSQKLATDAASGLSYCGESAVDDAALSFNCSNSERTNTCQADETETIKCWVPDGNGTEHQETIHVMECTECGHTYEHVNGSYEFCPRCGRRIVEADE